MKLAECMIGTAIVYALLGLGFVLLPLSMLDYLGIGTSAGAEVLARVVGAGLLGLAVIYYFQRAMDAGAVMPAINAAALSNIIVLVVLVLAITAGSAGPLAWVLVAINALIVLSFAYLGYMKRAA